jgi:hypothetical protein
MPWWAAKPLADEHRRALTDQLRANRLREESRALARGRRQGQSSSVQMMHSAPAAHAADVRDSERHSVGHHVGNWLIRAGTRLGGATMRTS